MAKGYWVVRVDVTDPDAFEAYQAFIGPFLAAHGGHFLVRGAAHSVPEGVARSRNVVVEFESLAAAQSVYDSAEYQAGIQLRAPASVADFVIVEGVDD